MDDPGYLLVSDFDGTGADTFSQNPKGVGVNEAYSLAIKDLFGKEGVKIYKKYGNLKNRAPEEIVEQILDIGNKKSLIKSAEKCFDSRSKKLNRLVPDGKGAPLEWIPGDETKTKRTITEMLVLIKLSYLMEEIGTFFPDGKIWPEPCRGFSNFFKFVDILKNKEKIPIKLAIISSGHEIFIQKTFEAWGLRIPDIIVTDDDMRGQSYPYEMERRVKPSSFLFDLVQSRWIGNKLLSLNQAQQIELIMKTRSKMMYFGDDLIKDGGLAKNSGVIFGHFDKTIVNPTIKDNGNLSFGDWNYVSSNFLTPAISKLRGGFSFKNI